MISPSFTMGVRFVLLLAMVNITMAADWDIEVMLSSTSNSIVAVHLNVTFYERELTSESNATIETMTISTVYNRDIPTVVRVPIPAINRPTKIDVWTDGSNASLWKLLSLTMESSSYNFTFECDCYVGDSSKKNTLFPTEDMWRIETETADEVYAAAYTDFTITVWDSSGISQTTTFYGRFKRGDKTTSISLYLHLTNPEKYQLEMGKKDAWFCRKFDFVHLMTCRLFVFDCGNIKYNIITRTVKLIGKSDCPTSTSIPTTTATDSTTAATTTTSTTAATTTTSTTAATTTTSTTAATTTTSTTAATTTTSTTAATTTTSTTAATDTNVTATDAVISGVSNNSQPALPCCPCVKQKPPVNMTTTQLQTVIKELKAELTVNKSALSASVRKKTSATDSRDSSKAIGFFGATFLAIPFVFMVVLDLSRLFQLVKP